MCQDIAKEVENHAVVNARVLATGRQLMAAQPGNVILRGRLKKLGCDWQRLITTLHDGESRLHAARMSLLPVKQAFNELMLWLQSIQKVIREGSSKSVCSSSDVQCEQQKYRVYTCTCIIVDLWFYVCGSCACSVMSNQCSIRQ